MELPTISAKKKALRQSFRVDRKFLVQPVTWNHLLDSMEFKSANMIASYISYGDEPDTKSLNIEILKCGKTLLLPRMRSDNFLDWVIWKGEAEKIEANKNIMEPIGDACFWKLLDSLGIRWTGNVKPYNCKLCEEGPGYQLSVDNLNKDMANLKVELQSLLSDQAYCSKELAEIEETWISLQEELERLSQ